MQTPLHQSCDLLRVAPFLEFISVKNVVSQYKGCGAALEKVFANQKGLCQPIWAWLFGILQVNAEGGAIP